MTFRKVEDLSKLEKGEFDIPEPKDNAPIQKNHDVILVPCVGLDNQGNRIGYGAGFYDKYLEGNNQLRLHFHIQNKLLKQFQFLMEM